MTAQPPFRRVGIAGLGLIGGSIALGVRARWPNVELVGFDRADRHEEITAGRVVDRLTPEIGGLHVCDLVMLALPLPLIVEALPATSAFGAHVVVTDVGSSKRQIMAAASAAGIRSFVGGHPMGGSERAGLASARADLLEDRPWILVSGSAEGTAAKRLERFVEGLGARPAWMAAEAHDRAVAYVSQLPQVIAVALMNAAQESVGTEGFAAAGRAFAEMTRLASSPSELWQGILASNADFVGEALEEFAAHLPILSDLQGQDWVRQAFDRAAEARAKLKK